MNSKIVKVVTVFLCLAMKLQEIPCCRLCKDCKDMDDHNYVISTLERRSKTAEKDEVFKGNYEIK